MTDPIETIEGEAEGDPRDRPPRDNLVRSMLTTEFRATETETAGQLGTLFGRMASYGVWAEVRSQVEGHFMERLAPGAFVRTFVNNRSRMQLIYDHGQDKNVGRNPIGRLEDVTDDIDVGDGTRAIDYAGALLDAPYVRDYILPSLKAGLLGSSYRFDTVKDTWKQNPARSEHNPDGIPERTVIEAKVIELGPTPFPVYAGTSAGVRSLTDEFYAQLILPHGQTALSYGPEASPHSVETRAEPVHPPISLDDFVRTLTNDT